MNDASAASSEVPVFFDDVAMMMLKDAFLVRCWQQEKDDGDLDNDRDFVVVEVSWSASSQTTSSVLSPSKP